MGIIAAIIVISCAAMISEKKTKNKKNMIDKKVGE